MKQTWRYLNLFYSLAFHVMTSFNGFCFFSNVFGYTHSHIPVSLLPIHVQGWISISREARLLNVISIQIGQLLYTCVCNKIFQTFKMN